MSLPGEDKCSGEVIIGQTESVCPVCLTRIPAERVKKGNDVYLRKSCKEHGSFKTIIWRGKPDFSAWYRETKADFPNKTLTRAEKGCPYDCGLCPDHRQQSCCVLLEVTQRCNLKCPVCFADAGTKAQADPGLKELKEQLEILMETAGPCNLQLSGGEPTVRDDLPAIIKEARSLGFTFIQLNTNGLRLAQEPGYPKVLKEAGLSTVFLQFDGTRDEIYQSLRGRSLFQLKTKAIENCARHQLGVVLVPTVVPGINSDQLGAIIRYAIKGMPVIRGVNIQPVSYFGRYPEGPVNRDRITLPEIMQALEDQTDGLIQVNNFIPSGTKHCLCSFHCDYLLQEDGSLTPISRKESAGCCAGKEEDAILKARNYIARRWEMQANTKCSCQRKNDEELYESWDRMLDRIKNYRLSITCIAFQDAENLDLERLKDCSLHFIAKGKIIPFCAYNMSNRDGFSLYREG